MRSVVCPTCRLPIRVGTSSADTDFTCPHCLNPTTAPPSPEPVPPTSPAAELLIAERP